MPRIALSLVAAALVHVSLVAAGLALIPAPSTREEPSAKVDFDVEVVTAKPDPVAAAVEPPAARRARPTRARAITAPHRAEPVVAHAPSEAPLVADVPAPSASPPHPATPARAESASSLPAAHESISAGTLLSARPRYRVNPAPEYPIASRRRREEGIVLVKVTVEASGVPSAISLATSSGYPLLDAAAIDAVRRWTFDPARAAGVPVSSLVTVPVRFSLADGP
jgi:protein TonB